MSTGLHCQFVEFYKGGWFLILQDWNCPVRAWDWREYATAYGPFRSEVAVDEYLRRYFANPGGAQIIVYNEELDKDETLKSLIDGAVMV